MSGPVGPLPNANMRTSSGFEEIVRRCLMVDRAARFATIGELRAALAACGSASVPASGVRTVLARPASDFAQTAVHPPIAMDSDAEFGPRTERSVPPAHRDSERTVVVAPLFQPTTMMAPIERSTPKEAPTLLSTPIVARVAPVGALSTALLPPLAPVAPSRHSSSPVGHTTLASGPLGHLVSDAPIVPKVAPKRRNLVLRALVPIALLTAAIGVTVARGEAFLPRATTALPGPPPGRVPPARPISSAASAAAGEKTPLRVVPPARPPVAAP
jgi:hypothetical protein